MAALDQVWNDPSTNVLSIVAFGGIGKTSLVIEWMAREAAKNWEGFDRVFDWSFFSQGTREQGGASSDTFINAALKFFGDEPMAQSAASAWDKAARLAQLVTQQRTLLVLDGVEPLQYPPGPLAGELKDPALATLLKTLAQNNSGLCVVTTRESITDLEPYQSTTAPEWQLDSLSDEAGSALLKSLLEPAKPKGRRQVVSTEGERREIVQAVKGHALTLQLLGGFIQGALGDVRKWREINFTRADAAIKGGYAFKTMSAYEKWLGVGGEEGARQLAILRLLGLFDRPADAGCIKALRTEPAITNLTEPLISLGVDDWNLSISSLEGCGLVSRSGVDQVEERESDLDAHPLIREYFASRLRKENPDAWREAHRRIYEHLCKATKEGDQPTLEDLQPLYQAIVHGCQAGLQQEACETVYVARIQRGQEAYSKRELGGFGSDLGAVACFFEAPWHRVSPTVEESYQAWLLNEAAASLRALGRLSEAIEPIRISGELNVKLERWSAAARSYSNLSEFKLTLGEIAAAVEQAEESIIYADRSDDTFGQLMQTVCRTALGDALHQADQAEAELHFREAESMHAERQPDHPLLYSMRGFLFCEWLLAPAERAAARSIFQPNTPNSELKTALASCHTVSKHAAQTLDWWINEFTNGPPLDLALNNLILGRTLLYEMILADPSTQEPDQDLQRTAADFLDAAVLSLLRSGSQHHIPRGFITRAWLRSFIGAPQGAQPDLDEAWEIAERGRMKLFMADIHLYRARLFGGMKGGGMKYPWNKNPDGSERGPKDDLAAARKLIEQCGYWRRKKELQDAEAAAKNW